MSCPDPSSLPTARLSAQNVVYRREPHRHGAASPEGVWSQRRFVSAASPTLRQSRHHIDLVHAPILHISLPNQTLRRPGTLVPWALTDVAPVLLVEHVKVRPVRTGVRIRPDRERRRSERAASHGRVDAVGSAVDDCAPGADAGGARC